MAMPEGIISVRINRETGCPARVGQSNTMFEFFREGHIPECEDVEDIQDIFNDAAGTDPEPEVEEDLEEESESLF
jgi:membrane carboxypeptidase/penicillin-binding protein